MSRALRAVFLLLYGFLSASVASALPTSWTSGVLMAGPNAAHPLSLNFSRTPLPSFTPGDLKPQQFSLSPVTSGLGVLLPASQQRRSSPSATGQS